VTAQRAVVRSATHADEAAVHEPAADMATSYSVDPGAFRTTFRGLVEADHVLLLVATVDDRVGGYALGFTHPTFFANGPVAWLEELAVDAELRRQGIGALLVEEFERRVGAAGVALVALATRRAADFYESIGYAASATYFRKQL
jgi:GNAT superfamily N-acetyltransferase